MVLDFFAYWCGPCLQTSRDLEYTINRYYEARNGNAHGMPVRVISINIEAERPEKTKAFIEKAGARFVLDDRGGKVLEQLGGKALPYIVVLKRDRESSGSSWQVVSKNNGYPGSDVIRSIIDSIKHSELDVNLVKDDGEKRPLDIAKGGRSGTEEQTANPYGEALEEAVIEGNAAAPDIVTNDARSQA